MDKSKNSILTIVLATVSVALVLAAVPLGLLLASFLSAHPTTEVKIQAMTVTLSAAGLCVAVMTFWMQFFELRAALVEMEDTRQVLNAQAETMRHQSDLALVTALLQSKQMMAEMYSDALPNDSSLRNTEIPDLMKDLKSKEVKERFQWKRDHEKPVERLAFYIHDTEGIHDSLAATARGVLDRLRKRHPFDRPEDAATPS